MNIKFSAQEMKSFAKNIKAKKTSILKPLLEDTNESECCVSKVIQCTALPGVET